MGMAHSIEGRFPFLDCRVVEFCNRLPPEIETAWAYREISAQAPWPPMAAAGDLAAAQTPLPSPHPPQLFQRGYARTM